MSRRDYVGESESMDAILASDRFVEQLRTTGTFEPSSREDAALASLLLEWRDEVREAPITPPPRVDDDAVASIKQQPRRIAQRSVAVAGALLAMSSAAATAFDGDPLRPVRFLVDLGITVGEGIGNPDNDDSTDGVELESQEIAGEDAAASPAITEPSDQLGLSGEESEDPKDAESPQDPGSPESTDGEVDPEADPAMPADPQPTGEAPPEEEPPAEEPPAEEPPAEEPPAEPPVEEPPVEGPGDGDPEPTEPTPTEPTPTTNGEDDGGEAPPDNQGGNPDEQEPDSGETPDPSAPGENAPGGDEAEAGDESSGDHESEGDQPIDEGASDDGSGEDDADYWDHDGSDWLRDAWPGYAWTTWGDTYPVGDSARRAMPWWADDMMGARDRAHPHQKAAWNLEAPRHQKTSHLSD